MSSPGTRVPINLTAATEHLSWSEVGQGVFIQRGTEGCALEVRGLDRVGDGYKSDGIADTVYVIASGYGVLRWGETALECTAGDVLFVPSGQAHRFERLDGTIRVWRISTAFSLVPEADAILAGPSGPVADASGGTILLVEDEPAVRVVTAEALRDHGFTILEAEDGPGASRGWRARPR